MSSNGPPDQCDIATIESIATCQVSGAVCEYNEESTPAYVCRVYGGLGISSTTEHLQCSNSTTAKFCPSGYYCTDGTATICPAGNYCPVGTASPIICPYGLMSCPESGTPYPYEGVVFGMMLLVFSSIMLAYHAFGRALIRYESASKNWDKVARVVSTRRYDAVNGLALEHDQHAVVRATGTIYDSMAAREKAMTSGKWPELMDPEARAVFGRFSMDLRGFSADPQQHATDHGTSPNGIHPPPAIPLHLPGSPIGSSAKSGSSVQSASNDSNSIMGSSHADISMWNNANKSPHNSLSAGAGDGRYEMRSPGFVMSPNAILSPNAAATRRLGVEGNHRGTVAKEGSRLLGKLQASMAHYDYEEVAIPLTVTFLHMNLVLKTTGVAVLNDISISIKPCHVTAIMGPSGAGKTSLLSLLRGQAHYAKITGSLTVNGHAVDTLERFRRRTAYVPQEDIVNDELSTEENILYSALLFNRRGYLAAAECMPMVLRAEQLLDISHIRTSVVGSPAKRGISGGQKKRVSIGMELMKEAELFFLDEPTSGLDSASSMLVVNALHFLASRGVTVSTTIHQPRQEILNLMDNLVLLAPGGRIAYFGPIIDVHEHFSRLHFTCPVGTNIADYVMDTLCGFVPMDGSNDVQEVQHTIDYLCDWWTENKYPNFRVSTSFSFRSLRQMSSLDDLESIPTGKQNDRVWRFGTLIQAIKVFWSCFNRQAKTNYRTLDTIMITCALLMTFGIVVAFLIGPLALDENNGAGSFSAQITSGSLVFSLLVQAASLRLLTADQLLRDREFNAGVLIAPYYLGKLLGNYAEACLYAFAFLVGYYPFLKARAPFIMYWYVFFLLHLAVSGLVNFIAVLLPGTGKGTFVVGAVVLLWSFGGISPPISVMEDSMSTFAVILNYLSPFKYSFTVEVINELSQYPMIWNVESLYSKLGYQVSDRNRSVSALVIYFVVSNLCAYIYAEFQQLSPKLWKDTQEKLNVASGGWLFTSRSEHRTKEFLARCSAAASSVSSLSGNSGSYRGIPSGPASAVGSAAASPACPDSLKYDSQVPSSDYDASAAVNNLDDGRRPSSILRQANQHRAPGSEKVVHWRAADQQQQQEGQEYRKDGESSHSDVESGAEGVRGGRRERMGSGDSSDRNGSASRDGGERISSLTTSWDLESQLIPSEHAVEPDQHHHNGSSKENSNVSSSGNSRTVSGASETSALLLELTPLSPSSAGDDEFSGRPLPPPPPPPPSLHQQ